MPVTTVLHSIMLLLLLTVVLIAAAVAIWDELNDDT